MNDIHESGVTTVTFYDNDQIMEYSFDHCMILISYKEENICVINTHESTRKMCSFADFDIEEAIAALWPNEKPSAEEMNDFGGKFLYHFQKGSLKYGKDN